MTISKKQAVLLGKSFQIDFNVIKFDEWWAGLNIELEHGSKISKMTNITNDNPDMTALIVIAHLLEDPQYYYYLIEMEKKRDLFWKNKKKPNIFLSIQNNKTKNIKTIFKS